MIGNSFQMMDREKEPSIRNDAGRLVDHLLEYLFAQLSIEVIDQFVPLGNFAHQLNIGSHEGLEGKLQHRPRLVGHLVQVNEVGFAEFVFNLEGDFRDVHCQVSDPFDIGDHLHDRADSSKVAGGGLLKGHQTEATGFDGKVALVDLIVFRHDGARQLGVQGAQRLDGLTHHLLGPATHFQEVVLELMNLSVERLSPSESVSVHSSIDDAHRGMLDSPLLRREDGAQVVGEDSAYNGAMMRSCRWLALGAMVTLLGCGGSGNAPVSVQRLLKKGDSWTMVGTWVRGNVHETFTDHIQISEISFKGELLPMIEHRSQVGSGEIAIDGFVFEQNPANRDVTEVARLWNGRVYATVHDLIVPGRLRVGDTWHWSDGLTWGDFHVREQQIMDSPLGKVMAFRLTSTQGFATEGAIKLDGWYAPDLGCYLSQTGRDIVGWTEAPDIITTQSLSTVNLQP